MKTEHRRWEPGAVLFPLSLVAFIAVAVGADAPEVPAAKSGATSAPSTTAPSSDYNKRSQGRTSDCAKLKRPGELIPLRYADGTPRGYYVTGAYPVTQRQLNRRDGKALDRSGCPEGSTEIDAREVVDSPAGKMLFHPGGGHYGKYPGGVDRWGQYGHILLDDLEGPPIAPDPYDGKPVGNGIPCAVAQPGRPHPRPNQERIRRSDLWRRACGMAEAYDEGERDEALDHAEVPKCRECTGGHEN